MPECYYMLFVKGIPKSTQIEWFVEKYSEGFYKEADLRYINNSKPLIDSNKDYVGVYVKGTNEYRYIFMRDVLDIFKSYTKVFYCPNDVPLGEL